MDFCILCFLMLLPLDFM